MDDYRVRFSNDLSDSSGHVHRVCQREVRVSASAGPEQAVEEAKRRFADAEGVSDWRLRARIVECDRAG